jgi:hypothetical protein
MLNIVKNKSLTQKNSSCFGRFGGEQGDGILLDWNLAIFVF